MAEKEQQQSAYQSTNGYVRSGGDAEGGAAHSHDSRQQRKKKRTKCFLYIVIFIIFQTAIITALALTVMKVKTPKFRIHRATVTTAVDAGTTSLKAAVTPEFSVKNTNFGRYKYRDTTVAFFYRGAKIGEVFVPNSRAGWRSTKKFIVSAVELNLSGSPQLSTDLSAGVVPITSSAQMRGRAELIFIMKKNRSTHMNCTMEIVTATQSIRNISCK